MRIRLRPIDWLEGYKEQQAAAMVERGIQRTLFCYGLDPFGAGENLPERIAAGRGE